MYCWYPPRTRDLDEEVPAVAMGLQLRGRVDVAVVVRRAFEDLAVLVAVAAGDLDQPGGLEDEVPLSALRHEPIRRPAWDDDVVAVLVGDVAEGGLERPGALVDEDDLVALAVPEEVVHRGVRPAERDLDVRVPHQGPPAADLVAAGLDVPGVHAAMRVRLGDPFLALDRRELAELLHAAGRFQVVQDRLVAREPLEPHHLFGEEASVFAKDDVTLAGNVAATLVERHGCPFRFDSDSARLLAGTAPERGE